MKLELPELPEAVLGYCTPSGRDLNPKNLKMAMPL
jgi:hypothetical protein